MGDYCFVSARVTGVEADIFPCWCPLGLLLHTFC